MADQAERGQGQGQVARSQVPLPGTTTWPSTLGLDDTIDQATSTIPLAWMAMLTGLIDGAIYSHAEIWTGFQTGNTVQVALGITTYLFPRIPASIPRTPLLLLLRSLSLLAFFLAGLIGARVGDRVGHTKRKWLIITSVLQAALMFGAAAILWSRPEREELTYRWWSGVIVLIASSMGLQSIQAQKLASPVFSTSVAFTATLTQLAADPNLFRCSTWIPCPTDLFFSSSSHFSTTMKEDDGETVERRQRWWQRTNRPRTHTHTHNPHPNPNPQPFFRNPAVRGRDLRLLALLSLAIGGGIAQSLLEVQAGIGLKGTMMVAAGCKAFLALLWFVPDAKMK